MPTDIKFAVEEFVASPTTRNLRKVLDAAADEAGIHPRFVDNAVAEWREAQEEYLEDLAAERADEEVEAAEKRQESKVEEAFEALEKEFRVTMPQLEGEAAKELEDFFDYVKTVFEVHLDML